MHHNFKRRSLYHKRDQHRAWNRLILTGFVLVGLMSWATTAPVKAQEAPSTAYAGPVEPVPTLENGTEAQNEVIRYAWQLSHDLNFIYTLNGENGTWNYQRIHNPRGNTVGTDMGLCGINSWFHPEIVTDPRFFSDEHWQLEQCYKMWKGSVKFYGYNQSGITIK